MKVLIVDDNKKIAEMISQFLKLEKFETVVSTDGKNGLALIQTETFDCVILDIAMPDFSGYDVIEELRKNGQISKQRIVILTASPNADEKFEELKKLGIHAILSKPIEPESLLEAIKG